MKCPVIEESHFMFKFCLQSMDIAPDTNLTVSHFPLDNTRRHLSRDVTAGTCMVTVALLSIMQFVEGSIVSLTQPWTDTISQIHFTRTSSEGDDGDDATAMDTSSSSSSPSPDATTTATTTQPLSKTASCSSMVSWGFPRVFFGNNIRCIH